ncbi:MAG: arsenate reductase family protein [Chlamydiia bacterium]|nr:arsenate reductase family protein [Chlamydiia bacterium]
MVKVYHYPKCSTCQRALKFLEGAHVTYEAIDIVAKPPSLGELKRMLQHYGGQVRKLFNTSGMLYREMGVKDRLETMTDEQALSLLSKHGKLIRRPFILTDSNGKVGFKESEWEELL